MYSIPETATKALNHIPSSDEHNVPEKAPATGNS